MITIFKDKKDIPENMEYVEWNDLFFNQNTGSVVDERAAGVIEQIDHSKLLGKYRISSRFTEAVLDIDRLSAGWKTILNVLYYPDKVFCLKECGSNALELLYSLEHGNVYSDYPMIPFEMKAVIAVTKEGERKINDYEELKEWWHHEE